MFSQVQTDNSGLEQIQRDTDSCETIVEFQACPSAATLIGGIKTLDACAV
jgi:hypothetical protein